MMTLEIATKILNLSLEKARTDRSKPLAVVITDLGGQIILAAREDGAGTARIDLALSKARSALALGIPTRDLGTFFEKNTDLHGVLQRATGLDLLPLAGGILIRHEGGGIVGAAGITGGKLPDEEAYLSDAVREAGLIPS